MDFAWNDTQTTLRDLARRILDDRVTHARLKELEAEADTVFDRNLWATLAEAGLLGTVVPEVHGGAGLTLVDLLPVLEELGRHVAPVPFVPTVVQAAVALAEHGDADLRAAWLPRIAAGEVVGTAAVASDLVAARDQPRVKADRDGDGWRLTGERPFVPYGAEADLLLVPATHGDALGLFAVTPDATTSITALVTTNRQPVAHVELDATPATIVAPPGPDGERAVRATAERGAAAWSAVQAGVCEAAIRMMAAHASSREQFGKRIAEFQAVAQRAADAFIDTQMVRLTAWQAMDRLGRGWDATKEVHVAKFWAGDGAMRALHAAQHVHGGLGVDTDYPLHRYFLWGKQIEHTLGTPTRELLALGDLLADEPV